jgi:hypothetical protein
MALALFVLMGMMAFGIDLGMLYSQRRQVQTSADAAALAGALAMGGDDAPAVADAMDLARRNLDASYDDAAWSALWTTCVDADRPPTFTPSAVTDCISIDHGAGLFRVAIPEQRIDAVFAGLLGVDEFFVGAVAVAGFTAAEVRPFAVASGQGSGEYCVQNPPGGHAKLPCTGPNSGNFGSMHNPRHSLGCPGNKNNALVLNIALGLDHRVAEWRVGDPLVVDDCPNIKPNQVFTDTGNFPNEATAGLATGGAPLTPGELPLLQQGTNPKKEVLISGFSYFLDDRPLWDYLVPNSTPGCAATDFDALTGVDATAQMAACLAAWTGGELFSRDLLESPRLIVVPELVEPDFGSGSDLRTIADFRAVFINAVGFRDVTFYPGDPGGLVIADGSAIEQTTSFLLPGTPALSDWLLTGPDGVLRVQKVELVS